MTFEDYCKEHGIELLPWQKEAATAFLTIMHSQRAGATGKTFLIKYIDEFINRSGNVYEI